MRVLLKYVNRIVMNFFGDEGKGVVSDILLIPGRRGSERIHGTPGLQSRLPPSRQR